MAFLGNFKEDKMLSKLVLSLSRVKMDPKKKVKYFKQWFLTLRNKIPQTSKPTNDVNVEF